MYWRESGIFQTLLIPVMKKKKKIVEHLPWMDVNVGISRTQQKFFEEKSVWKEAINVADELENLLAYVLQIFHPPTSVNESFSRVSMFLLCNCFW